MCIQSRRYSVFQVIVNLLINFFSLFCGIICTPLRGEIHVKIDVLHCSISP